MFEQVLNFIMPAGQPAQSVATDTIRRDATGRPLTLEAWQSGGNTNLYLIAGNPTAAEAAAMVLGQASAAAILCVIPAGAMIRRSLPDDVAELTVYADGPIAAAEPQAATVRITSDS